MYFNDKIKVVLLFCYLLTLTSCSIFNDDKEIPKGTRISILDSQNTSFDINNKTISEYIPITSSEQWLQKGGNANHVMGNLSANNNIKKLWQKNFGEGSDKRNLLLAQPIISGEYIYTQDVDATVSAFNIKDGKKIWKRKIKPNNVNSEDNGLNGVGIASDGEKIYAVTGFGSVIALDALNGNQLWRIETKQPIRIAPNICLQKLIIQTIDNKLLVLNTTDGSEIYRYDTSYEDTILAGGAVASCSIDKNLIAAGFSNGMVETFNADIGYPLWSLNVINTKKGNSTTNINAIKASPIIDGEYVYTIGNNDMFMAADYRTGEIIWSQEIGSTNTPWVAGNYIYVVSNNNELICFNKLSGEIIFKTVLLNEYDLNQRTEIYLFGPIMVNNKLLVSASNGIVYAISSSDGSIIHKLDLNNNLAFSPISAKNTVVFTTSDADIIIFK